MEWCQKEKYNIQIDIKTLLGRDSEVKKKWGSLIKGIEIFEKLKNNK